TVKNTIQCFLLLLARGIAINQIIYENLLIYYLTLTGLVVFHYIKLSMCMLKNDIKIIPFVLLMSFINFLFFHFPFYSFVFKNVHYQSLNGIIIISSLTI